MTLTDDGKKYIASHFGKSRCYVSSGIGYTDPAGKPASGGTSDVVSTLKLDDGGLSRGPGNEIYSDIVTANDGGAVTNTDIVWIASNDGTPSGEARYCVPRPSPCGNYGDVDYDGYVTSTDVGMVMEYLGNTRAFTADQKLRADVNGDGVVDISDASDISGYVNGTINTFSVCPTPTPTPTPSPEAPAGTFVFVSSPTGIPTVSLDLSTLVMRQATDYHFEMNSIKITNTSSWRVYLAMEVKLFSGVRTTCPTTGYVFDGLDRMETTARETRIKIIEPGVQETYNGDFYQPLTIAGVHTVCLLVHGTWTQAELESEISPITG